MAPCFPRDRSAPDDHTAAFYVASACVLAVFRAEGASAADDADVVDAATVLASDALFRLSDMVVLLRALLSAARVLFRSWAAAKVVR